MIKLSQDEEYGKTVKIDPEKVIDFFKRVPDPNDEQFHSFAKRNNFNPHEAEAEAYRLATKYVNFLKGGRSNEKNIKSKDVNPDELKTGIQVEMEHTPDKDVAERIALDHLAEVKHYYTGLKGMEKTLDEAGDQQMAKKAELFNRIATKAFIDELQKIAACPFAGKKIGSKGRGRGLAIGQGRGPIGIPIGKKKEK